MQKSFVSVMNALDYVSSDIVLIENIKVSDVDTIENFDFNYDYDSQSVFFEFSSKDITTSVHKIEGETEHIFSNIHVKNLSDYLVLKTMKLKINGNYSGIIKKIDLIYDDIIISSAYNIDGQFVFENIDFLLPENSEKNIEMSILFEGMQVNDHFKFSIDDQNSLLFLKNKHKFNFKYAYPISTPYITIYK